MNNHSFSLLLQNLLIGLSKGSRILRPYSTEFHSRLGYNLFQIEASFRMTHGGRSAPDLLFKSELVGNTFLVEMTQEHSISDHKKDQLQRYSKLTKEDLTVTLAVPPQAVNSFNTCIIVCMEALSSYQNHIISSNYNFPLITFNIISEPIREYELKLEYNSFNQPNTQEFFHKGIKLRRIPMHFIEFPIDDPNLSALVSYIVRHILTLVLKSIETITVEEFCADYIKVWPFIGDAKKKNLIKKTREVLNYLHRTEIGRLLISRVTHAKIPTWDIIADANEVRRNIKSIRKRLQDFINKIQGLPNQEELEFPD